MPDPSRPWMIYGANGFTGRLVAARDSAGLTVEARDR
jgi:short subunit dehydrogenase-like uncharacterized protein